MADKTIAIKVDLVGSTEQGKKLAKLEDSVLSLSKRNKSLNKALKEGDSALKKLNLTRAQAVKELALNNTKLKGYRTELLKTRQSILGLDSFTKKLGKSFSKLGTSISGAFVGLFAVQKFFQIVSDGVKTIEEFEQQMANVLAVTGATEVEFKALTASAKELGRTSLFTSMEVGELQEELAKLGFTTPEILAASDAILQLATASGAELSQSAVVAASTLRGFGLEATETQRVVDVMAASFSSSSLDINKFQTAMAAVAPVAKAAGFSLEETTSLLGTLTDAGFDASTAGTGLRNIFLEIEKRGITLEEAFEEIRGSSDKTTTALELFDKRGAALAITLADNEMKSKDLTEAFNGSQGAAKDMADVMANTSVGATKKLESAWDGLILTIGEGSEKGFASFKAGFADFLNDVSDFVGARDKLLESGVELSIGDRYFGLGDDQAANLKKINDQEKFLNKNLTNRSALLKRESELVAEIRRIKNEEFALRQAEDLNDEEEDRVVWLKNQRRILQAAAQDLRIQAGTLKEINKQEEANAKTAALNAEVEAKAVTKITDLKLDELKKLGTEEADAEIKRRKERDATNKKIAESDKKLSERIVKLKQDALLLEIRDKREAEFQKLSFAEQNAIREVELTVSTEEKKIEAIRSIRDKFQAERDALARKNAQKDAEDKKKEDDKAIKESEKKAKEDEAKKLEDKKKDDEEKEQLRQAQIAFAEETANALIDVANDRVERQKSLELASLDAQLNQGLITQEEFEAQREAIERKAFEKQKKIDVAQAISNGALAITKTIAELGGVGAITPFGAASIALVTAQTAAQVGVISSQKFAEGGYTGDGFGSADSTGFKPAGVVHEGEYVVPKRILESQKGGQLVGALESMRMNKPTPLSSIGFANGGFTSGTSSIDMAGLRNEISAAVAQSIGAIQVVNNATDTVGEAVRVSNIQAEASFG